MRYRYLAQALVLCASPAIAEDCSQVLKEGTKKSTTWANNFVSTQIAYSLLQSSDITNRQESKASEFGIGFGPWSASNKRTKSSVEAYDRQLKKLNLLYLNDSQQIMGAISSGDSVIVNGWLTCMLKQQGLIAYFLPTTGSEVTLVLKWIRDPNDPSSLSSTTIKTSIIVPKWMVPRQDDGPRCWKLPVRGADFRQGDGVIDVGGCSVTYSLDRTHDKEPVSIRINTRRGGADVFLPPRVRYIEEEKLKIIEVLANVPLTQGYKGTFKSEKYKLEESPISEGWIIDPTSFVNGSSSVYKVNLNKRWYRSCGRLYPTEQKETENYNPVLISDEEVEFGASGLSRHHGSRTEYLTCKFTASVRLFRVKEYPIQ